VDGRLTVVSGPPGAGKTTLLSGWAQNRPPGEVVWLSAGEGDPVRHISLLQHHKTSEAHDGDVDVRPDRRESCPPSTVVVVDDIHMVTDPRAWDALARAIEAIPPRVRVVLAGRRIPPALQRSQLAAGATLIGPSDLAFTIEECAGLMALGAGVLLPVEALSTLTQRSEGWAAGLYLVASVLRDQEDPEGFVRRFSGCWEPVAAYIEHETLQRQPPDLVRFLLQTSVLAELNAELCAAVTGRSDAGRVLSDLAEGNLFVTGAGAQKTSYRYHRLLGDLLRDRLELEDSEIRLKAHISAGAWYRDAGDVDEAAYHFGEAGALDQAFEMVLSNLLAGGVSPRRAGCPDGSRDGVRQLSERWPGSDPFRTYVLAASDLAAGRTERAMQMLRHLDAVIAADPARRVWHRRVEFLWAVHALRVGDPAGVIDHCRSAQATAAGYPRATARKAVGCESGPEQLDAAITAGLPVLWTRAILHLAGPLHLSESSEGDMDAGPAGSLDGGQASLAAMVALRHGRLPDAYRLARTALQDESARSDHTRDGFASMEARLVLADVLFEQNELLAAEQLLLEALDIASSWQGSYWNWPLEINLVAVLTAQQRLGEALDRVGRLRLLEARNPPPLHWQQQLDQAEIGARVVLGDLDGARRIARALGALDSRSGIAARIHLISGGSERAIAMLEPRRTQAVATEIRRTVLLARIRAQRGEKREAAAAIRRAIESGRQGWFIRPFVDDASAILPLLVAVAGSTPDPYLSRLIAEARRRGPEITSPDPVAQTPPRAVAEPLTNRERVVLRYLASHLSQPQIADAMYVSLSTVKTHTKAIYRKIGASSRAQAIDIAHERSLL
jgi:LuxR family maltose regulon positive regulatory protein